MPTASRILVALAGVLAVLIPTGLVSSPAQAAPGFTVGPGTAIVIDGSAACTLAVAGHDKAGRLIGLSAGHCGNVGSKVALENRRSGVIGTIVAKNKQVDYSVINFNKAVVRGVRTVGKATVTSVGQHPAAGARVCKSGRTTGYSCGQVIENSARSYETLSYVCAAPGDSGGPVIAGGKLVGILTGGAGVAIPFTNAGIIVECLHPAIPIYSPMIATKVSVVLDQLNYYGGYGAGFRPV
ncbi:MAG: S1 family peptidase [Gordonia amarae]